MASRKDIYESINNRIIAALEKGVVPWHQPWNNTLKGINSPTNIISKKPYNGINHLLLSWEVMDKKYSTPLFMTFKQCQELGGRVIKGEKSSEVIFWNVRENDEELDDNGKPKKIFLLRSYNVFNLDQTTGINLEGLKIEKNKVVLSEKDRIEAGENIVKGMPNAPVIRHEGNRAFYRPTTDVVTVPEFKNFKSAEGYYNTLFHELSHSTGHKDRLNRKGIAEFDTFGSDQYSEEELIAEMSASYLMGMCGMFDKEADNSASYIKGWLSKFKGDTKFLITAANKSQKAADYILGKGQAEA